MAGAPERLRLALTASFLSRGWAAGISLLAVPLYLRYLGLEAYGVVGLFVSLSAIVGLLDLGLGATLTREMSKVPGGQVGGKDARDAARTFELVYFGLAVLVGLLGAALAYPLGMFWITVESLSRREVTEALMLASLALACQWPGNLHAAGLAGLQRQVCLGVASATLATTRVGLTLLAVWWTPSLHAFFGAQIAAALLQTCIVRYLFWKALGDTGERSVFRWQMLTSSLSFAGGMSGIALTSVIQTQADKIVLSRALSLPEFGVYSVASVLAAGLYIVISPIFSVMFPRFSSHVHLGDVGKLVSQYRISCQLMAAIVIPPAMLLAVFGESVLSVWTGDNAMGNAGGRILLFLVLGNACNGLVNMPYAIQLAHGRTRLMLCINICSIVLLVPGVWWAASRYGAVGGAAVWALLNLGYLLILPSMTHRHYLSPETRNWHRVVILWPTIICMAIFLVLHELTASDLGRLTTAFVLFSYWSICAALMILVMPDLRQQVIELLVKRTRR